MNWAIVASLSTPIIGLLVGVVVNRAFESKPKLVFYKLINAVFHDKSYEETPFQSSHAIYLKNVGRKPATNVRISHKNLPAFNISPPLPYTVEKLEHGYVDIVIPMMVADQQLGFHYLYLPPTTPADINTGIRCEEGFAKEIPIIVQRKPARWLMLCCVTLMVVGAMAIGYGLYEGIAHLISVKQPIGAPARS